MNNLSHLTIAMLFISLPLLTMANESRNGLFQCLAESRNGDACTTDADPVCGFRPHAICDNTGPCYFKTYENPCEACHDDEVVTYTYGACPEIVPLVRQCSDDSRGAEVCSADYNPVCGFMSDIFCTSPPCNFQTFESACSACLYLSVDSYIEGECSSDQLQYFSIDQKSGELLKLSALAMGLMGALFTLF